MTPFDTNKQKILLYAVGYTIANIEFANLRITNVQVREQKSSCLFPDCSPICCWPSLQLHVRQGYHALLPAPAPACTGLGSCELPRAPQPLSTRLAGCP